MPLTADCRLKTFEVSVQGDVLYLQVPN